MENILENRLSTLHRLFSRNALTLLLIAAAIGASHVVLVRADWFGVFLPTLGFVTHYWTGTTLFFVPATLFLLLTLKSIWNPAIGALSWIAISACVILGLLGIVQMFPAGLYRYGLLDTLITLGLSTGWLASGVAIALRSLRRPSFWHSVVCNGLVVSWFFFVSVPYLGEPL